MAKTSEAMVAAVGIALAAGYLHLHAAPLAGSRAVPPWLAQIERPAGSVVPGGSVQKALLDRYCVTCHNERL